jgi:hypothetical protein
VLSLVLGLVASGLTAGATPAVAETPTASSVERLCGPAQPGLFTCFGMRHTGGGTGKGVKPTAQPPKGYSPADLLDAYALPRNGGAGTTVAIVDAYDNPNAEADLAVYRAQYGLPPCTTAGGCFHKVDQWGGNAYPIADEGWAGEMDLDLDMVSAIAPRARIILVEASTARNADLGTAVHEAVART